MSAWNWYDLVPNQVSVNQHRWERMQTVVRMRGLGFAYKDIGKRLGVGPVRARQLFIRAEREKAKGIPSPVEHYMRSGQEDIRTLGRALGGKPKPLAAAIPEYPPPSPTNNWLRAELKKAQKEAAHWEKEARFWYQRADELLKQQRRQ